MSRLGRVAILSAYFEQSLVDHLVERAESWGVALHLWALESPSPAAEPSTRGSGTISPISACRSGKTPASCAVSITTATRRSSS